MKMDGELKNNNLDDRQVKQVIVFRHDFLKGENALRKGKIAGQVAHASVGALLKHLWRGHIGVNNNINFWHFSFANDSMLDKWLNGIFTKVCVEVENENALLELYNRIKNERPDIPCVLITDAGNTEFHGKPTNTCIGIGPWWNDDIDKYTGELKLF